MIAVAHTVGLPSIADRIARPQRTWEGIAMPTPIQDEPESTVGRKPMTPEHPERPEHGRGREGAAARRDEAREKGAGANRERNEPPASGGLVE